LIANDWQQCSPHGCRYLDAMTHICLRLSLFVLLLVPSCLTADVSEIFGKFPIALIAD